MHHAMFVTEMTKLQLRTFLMCVCVCVWFASVVSDGHRKIVILTCICCAYTWKAKKTLIY